MINKQLLKENLNDFLPIEIQGKQDSKCYDSLVDAFYQFITAPKHLRDEKLQSVYHARQILEDFCEFERKRKDGPSMSDLGWGSIS